MSLAKFWRINALRGENVMPFERILTLAAYAAAVLAVPVYADSAPAEGVVIAIMGDSDRVDLLPGQTIIFRPDAGKLTFIRFVKGAMEPKEGELKLEFGSLGGQTSLIATSKADQGFNYNAEIVKKMGAKKGKKTSVCTIIAGGGAFETWPYAIPVLRVMNFKPAAEGEMGCR
jgi:hypothetical protein